MKRTRRAAWLVAAAASAALAWTRPALAQYPAGQDGHALDASNRVGGPGGQPSNYNTPTGRNGRVTGNDIVYGNVTGGMEFRGPHPFDPRAFSGPSSRVNDYFVRGSSGVPPAYTPPAMVTGPQIFYGDYRSVAPPVGSVPIGFSGGYIGTTPLGPTNLNPLLNSNPSAVGLQPRTMQPGTYVDQLYANNSTLSEYGPQASTLGNAPLTYNSASSLNTATFANVNNLTGTDVFHTNNDPGSQFQRNGIQGLNGNVMPDQSVNNSLTPNQINANPLTPNGQQTVQQTTGQQGRPGSQNNQSNQNDQNNNGNNTNNGQNGSNGQQPSANAPLNHALVQPFDSPANANINSQITSSSINNSSLGSGLRTQETTRTVSTAVANAPSKQISELENRLQRYDQSNGVLDDVRAHQQAVASAQLPNNTGVATANRNRNNDLEAPAEPLKIESLSAGVKEQNAAQVLSRAEQQMQEGRYTDAIESYDVAMRQYPMLREPLLGRAFAELGASYYAQADLDLRQMIRTTPALLMGRFDIDRLIGADRAKVVREDLTKLAQENPTSSRPWFLLAWLDYGRHDTAATAKDLDEAQRLSPRDPAISSLRSHWQLSATPGAATPGVRTEGASPRAGQRLPAGSRTSAPAGSRTGAPARDNPAQGPAVTPGQDLNK